MKDVTLESLIETEGKPLKLISLSQRSKEKSDLVIITVRSWHSPKNYLYVDKQGYEVLAQKEFVKGGFTFTEFKIKPKNLIKK